MPKSSCPVQIPAEVGARFRVLFCVGRIPETVVELGDLLQEYVKKCLKEPRLKAHFQAIYDGRKIFGNVDYKTRHRVRLPNAKEVYIACALDTLVEGFFLPIEINSACFHCDQPIRITMTEGTINSVEPSSSVMWLGASSEGEGSCGTNLCPYINFFSSSEHITEWKDRSPSELGVMLTLEQSLELARKSYWEPIHLICKRS
jgi:hypothetical protein